MTGGGSGGHITPILAVAHELKRIDPNIEVIYIGQRGDSFAGIIDDNSLIDETYMISAGKFRRYHTEGWRQILDVHTMYLNIRDGFRFAAGFWQSFWLLGRINPDAIFCKGGFVGVPVGLAAALRRIPYMTHDSDAIPGLANRIISRWAKYHAVALDEKLYPYPRSKTYNVGVPISPLYSKVDVSDALRFRKECGLSSFGKVVLITGGGRGAARLNEAAIKAVPELLADYPDLAVVHTAGTDHVRDVTAAYEAALDSDDMNRIVVLGYTTELYKYSGAADVVVARGGATNLAELAAQAKPCIIVPNPFLTGGHQLKNSLAFEKRGAVVVVSDTELTKDHTLFRDSIKRLLDDTELRKQLSENLHSFARPDSAKELARLVVELGTKKYRG